jgi:hypothetical protein
MAPILEKGVKRGNRPQSAPRFDGFRRNPRIKGASATRVSRGEDQTVEN